MELILNKTHDMISIIIPIYNVEKYLNDCLESVQQQTYSDFEVLMVDDGSKDGSAGICREYEEKDDRFHYYHQENAGVSAARNLGLEYAKGEYICFVDADDMVAQDYLSHLLKLSSEGGLGVCNYTQDIDKLGEKKGEDMEYEAHDCVLHVLWESAKNFNLWMMLFKASIIHNQNIRFTVGCVRNEDIEFYVNYLLYEEKVKVSGYMDYYYRPNPTSVMRQPINKKSLTSIEASRRINDIMFRKGIVFDKEILFSNGVLKYAFGISKWRDKDLYVYLHAQYDVKRAMRKMLSFPRLSKRIVALVYLLCGKKVFYLLIGSLFQKKGR